MDSDGPISLSAKQKRLKSLDEFERSPLLKVNFDKVQPRWMLAGYVLVGLIMGIVLGPVIIV